MTNRKVVITLKVKTSKDGKYCSFLCPQIVVDRKLVYCMMFFTKEDGTGYHKRNKRCIGGELV